MSSKQRNKKKVNANTSVESASEPKNLKPDISHLRRPFETNIFGLEKVVELFHKSTEEVIFITFKSLLLYALIANSSRFKNTYLTNVKSCMNAEFAEAFIGA